MAVPYLTSYLRRNGFFVVQRDLNAMAYDFFLTKEYLRQCLRKTSLISVSEFRQVIKNIDRAKRAMRDIGVYRNFTEFSKNKNILEKAFDIICVVSKESLRIKGNTFGYEPMEYSLKNSYKSRLGIFKAIKNKKDNIFFDFFKKQVIPFLKKEKPFLVGISIFDQKQLMVAFILATLIKEAKIKTKIVFGGNIITRLYDVFSKNDLLNRKLFNLVDFMIHNEGEMAIAELARRLSVKSSQKYNFEKIPKLIYKKNGQITVNLEFNITDLREASPPDFEGFDIDFHWTPQPVIGYLTKRGCQHQCAFCDTPFGYDGYYKVIEAKTKKKFKIVGGFSACRALPIKRVIEEIKFLKEKYKSEYFSFGDEELLNSFLQPFCRQLIKRRLNIKWECFARMEPAFKDRNTCRLLKRAGCMFIQFGLESVSQRVLDFENKMVKAADYPLILKNTNEAGIMNHVFFLIGTPFDNIFEAIKILSFLENYGEYIYTIRPIIYKASKWSPNAFAWQEKGLDLGSDKLDLDIDLDMWRERPKYGMDFFQAKTIVKLIELWVRYRHKLNPITRTYIHAQRLFVGPSLIRKFSKEIKNEIHFKPEEEKTLEDFSKILIEELKKAAFIFKREATKKINYLYDSESKRRLFFGKTLELIKARRHPLSLDEITNFSKQLYKIDRN